MDTLPIEKDKDTLKIEGTAPKGDEDVNYPHTEELVEDLPQRVYTSRFMLKSPMLNLKMVC